MLGAETGIVPVSRFWDSYCTRATGKEKDLGRLHESRKFNPK